MSVAKYFWNKEELDLVIDDLRDPSLHGFLQFSRVAQSHTLYSLYQENGRLEVISGDKTYDIGISFRSDKSPEKQVSNMCLLSLNCGNFDANSNVLRDESRYVTLKNKLNRYIQSFRPRLINFQDFPCDQELFATFSEDGYRGIWVPNFMFSEGSISVNGASGLISLAHIDEEYELIDSFISIHQAIFPRFSNYTHGQDRDLITINTSLYQVFIQTIKQQIWIITNTHISPFSRAKDRLENITNTVKNIIEIKQRLSVEYPEYTINERFTGDMNLYGVNSLYNSLRMKVNPWGFGLPLLSSLFTGRNRPNERELESLKSNLALLGYGFAPHNEPCNHTIFIDIEKYAPRPFNSLFRHKRVGWQLDLCIVPMDQKVSVGIDREPFGDFDHSSLRVT
jgi:hypothetical protein